MSLYGCSSFTTGAPSPGVARSAPFDDILHRLSRLVEGHEVRRQDEEWVEDSYGIDHHVGAF